MKLSERIFLAQNIFSSKSEWRERERGEGRGEGEGRWLVLPVKKKVVEMEGGIFIRFSIPLMALIPNVEFVMPNILRLTLSAKCLSLSMYFQ